MLSIVSRLVSVAVPKRKPIKFRGETLQNPKPWPKNSMQSIFSLSRGLLFYASFLDSRFRGNDRRTIYFVIPAKAGIQASLP